MEISEVISNWGKKVPVEEENKHSISELCRLCGNANSNFLPIYGGGVDNNLRKKIEMHLPIRLNQNDGLPQRVCYFCASTVLSFSDIYESVLNVEENFHRILKNASLSKQVVCVGGNKVADSGLARDGSRKAVAPARDDLGRSQPQDRESISQHKLESGLNNASLTVFDHSSASALLDELENGIIDNQPVACNKPSATIAIVRTVVMRNEQEACYTGPAPAQSTQTRNPGARFRGSRFLKTEDTCATTMISNEVVNIFAESSCETGDSQIEFYRDVLPYSNGSKAVSHTESSAGFSDCSDPRPQSKLNKACRYKYTLKMIRNGRRDLMYVIVQWQKIRNNDVMKCKYCKHSFHDAKVFLTHSRFHTRRAPFYCKYCGRSFMLWGSLKYHGQQCIKAKEHLKIATGSYRSPGPYILDGSHLHSLYDSVNYNQSTNPHHLAEGSEGKYCCELCGKNYKLRTTLKEHLMHHLGKGRRKLKCEKCFVKFLTKPELLEHLKGHDDNLVCELCGKVVLNEKDLQTHLVSHSTLRPYSCNVCGVTYKRKSHMTRHLLSHETETTRKFDGFERDGRTNGGLKCDICGEESSTWGLHRTHMKTHKEQKYECDECGKLFAQPSGVTRHKHTVHKKARDFSCEQCKQSFSTKATLVNHLLIHTGERPHQCTICGKTFRTRQQQKMHEKIHSDVFPFQCEHCPKKFRRKLHLIVHIRTHTGERPYVCPICGRGFAQCNDRKKHMNVHR